MDNEYKDDTQEDKENRNFDNHHNDGYEEFCIMCRRPESQTGKLIHLPGNICVCSRCMQNAFDSFQNSGLQYSDLMNMSTMMPSFDLSGQNQTADEKQSEDGDSDHDEKKDNDEKKDGKEKKSRGPNISMML